MVADNPKNMKPTLKKLQSEYFDWDGTTRAIPMNKFSQIHSVSEISDKLIDMGWIYFIEESCNKVLYSLIDKKIIKHENKTKEPVLDKIHDWFQSIVMKWLERILERENQELTFSNVARRQA